MSKLKAAYILLITLFLSGTSISFGQTITIGSGTNTNGYNEASPVNITRDRTVCQIVYTAAELTGAGAAAGDINRMGFYVTNIPVNDIPGYTIQMKHTNAPNAGQNLGGGWTEVKSAFTYTAIQGDWDMHDFDVPFSWNGIQNLAVRICWSTANNDPSGQLRTYPATNGFRYRWTNNGNGSYCGSTPNTNRQWKPQVRFVFETETVWDGSASTNWFDPANWSAGVPDETMDTRVPTGTPNDPVLNGVTSTANFTLQGSMTINPGGELNVYNDFINTGTFIDNGGETKLTGTGPNVINNSATLEMSNLTIDSKFGATVGGSMITITGELSVDRSALNTNDSITLRSDAAGTARIDELTTNCFYSVDMFDQWGDGWNGGLLTVLEDGVPVFQIQAFGSSTTETLPIANGSLLQLSYSSGEWENENSYTLFDPSGTPIFNDGPNPATGIVFSTTATCGFTDPISGEIVMERYIDAGETYWRYFGSAVQGADLEQFDDDFKTAGYPGSLYPAFGWVSAYNYDESLGGGLGYLEATSSAQVMGVGEGWQIWCGDTITGTQPFTFDLRGVPNQGDINLPVTYTNYGLPAEDGFNLVSNPYPSTIDWDDPDWTKTNMANAVYIQDPDNQQYATYVAGASTNGGSRYIASQQSFWVQAFAAGPVLGASEGVKSSNDQQFIKNGNQHSPGMTIRLNGNQEYDEAVMRHIDGAVDDFDPHWDAQKYWGGWGEYPQLSLINGYQKDLTVHSFDKGNQEWQFPLRAIVFQDGNYSIEFEHVGEMDVPCMYLEDTYDGTMYEVYEGASYTFFMDDSTYNARFIIHVGRNYDIAVTDASCYGDADGEVMIDLDDPNPYDYELILNGNSTYGNDMVDPLVLTDLSMGVYSLVVTGFSNLCAQDQFNFVVNEPNPFDLNATVHDEVDGNDGHIVTVPSGGTAPYLFEWSNGGTGAAQYFLPAGDYSVLMTDANGCEVTESYTINSVLTVDEFGNEVEFILNRDYGQITIMGILAEDGTIFNLYNLNGQLIQSYQLQSNTDQQSIDLPLDAGSGMYILQSTTNQAHTFKFVF